MSGERLKNGKVKIVIGARSAVFAPFKELRTYNYRRRT